MLRPGGFGHLPEREAIPDLFEPGVDLGDDILGGNLPVPPDLDAHLDLQSYSTAALPMSPIWLTKSWPSVRSVKLTASLLKTLVNAEAESKADEKMAGDHRASRWRRYA
jgi:hypothetical protein